MKGRKQQIISKTGSEPYKIVTETLADGGADLKSFYFKKQGGNFYVFGYEKGGRRRYTFIDSGDFLYRDHILNTLRENDVEPAGIERIIVTHRHRDHCGLTGVLAEASGAKILARAEFRDFVEGTMDQELRPWLRGFDPATLRKYEMVYLAPLPDRAPANISGLSFPRLSEPIDLGPAGLLEILACPEDAQPHTVDQLLVLYSPPSHPGSGDPGICNFRPTDQLIFAGDLWLMHGPLFSKGLWHFARHVRFAYYRLRSLLAGNPVRRWNPREQDMAAKEALKRGFCLIRVKPGHGEEFLGTRIIPNGLLADRDILTVLGYSLDDDRSLLKTSSVAPKVAEVLEQAYGSFVKELTLWRGAGFDADDISDLLVRIYREQEGGGSLVAQDRRERRIRLKETLKRLRDEGGERDSLGQIAASTLLKLPRQ